MTVVVAAMRFGHQQYRNTSKRVAAIACIRDSVHIRGDAMTDDRVLLDVDGVVVCPIHGIVPGAEYLEGLAPCGCTWSIGLDRVTLRVVRTAVENHTELQNQTPE